MSLNIRSLTTIQAPRTFSSGKTHLALVPFNGTTEGTIVSREGIPREQATQESGEEVPGGARMSGRSCGCEGNNSSL